MDGVNQVILMGSVGKDAEVKFIKDGSQQVAKFAIATNRSYKDKDGVKQTQTEWHNIEVWGDIAKYAGQFVKKGDKYAITGQLRYDKYTDKDGKAATYTKIAATQITLIAKANPTPVVEGSAEKVNEAAHQAEAYANAGATANPSFVGSNDNDDLPF